jgi:hypothetical protein
MAVNVPDMATSIGFQHAGWPGSTKVALIELLQPELEGCDGGEAPADDRLMPAPVGLCALFSASRVGKGVQG